VIGVGENVMNGKCRTYWRYEKEKENLDMSYMRE
jgi:hypothetical protein